MDLTENASSLWYYYATDMTNRTQLASNALAESCHGLFIQFGKSHDFFESIR